MLSYTNLSNYYFLIHQLTAVQHKYTTTELESMLPFERDIYVGLNRMHSEEENRELML